MARTRMLALIALLALGGCGGEEEPAPSAQGSASTTVPSSTSSPTAQSPPPQESTSSVESEGEATPPPEEEGGSGGSAAPSPEQQEGGAGDEEAASTAVALVGRDGRVTPARVEVPPYIAVRVSLRAADAGSYTMSVRGRTLRAGDALTLDGLVPEARYVLRTVGGDGRVVIRPSSEPGQ